MLTGVLFGLYTSNHSPTASAMTFGSAMISLITSGRMIVGAGGGLVLSPGMSASTSTWKEVTSTPVGNWNCQTSVAVPPAGIGAGKVKNGWLPAVKVPTPSSIG